MKSVQAKHARMGLLAVLLSLSGILIIVLGTQIKSAQDAKCAAEEKMVAALRRAQLIIESSDQAMIVCDDRGVITETNSAAGVILGWSNAELVGKDSDMLVPSDMQMMHRMGISRARKSLEESAGDWLLTSNRRLLTAVRKDGSTVDTFASVRAIKYGGKIDFILSFTVAEPPDDKPLQLQRQEKLSDVETIIGSRCPDYAQIVKQATEAAK